MTPRDLAARYAAAFPDWPPLRADDRWLDGVWVLGNDYRAGAQSIYGSYPPNYLRRVMALFPDVPAARTLHVFSGALQGGGVRVDRRITDKVTPSICADATALPFRDATFELCLADPPYSPDDAVRYGTPMVDRRKALREIARVLRPGGVVVWLDTVLPMFSKTQFHWFGAVCLVRSTNHRVRLASFFQRTV